MIYRRVAVFCPKDVDEAPCDRARSELARVDWDFAIAVDFEMPADAEELDREFVEPAVANDSESGAALEIDLEPEFAVDSAAEFAAVELVAAELAAVLPVAVELVAADFDSAGDSEPDFAKIPPLNKSVLQSDRKYMIVSFQIINY